MEKTNFNWRDFIVLRERNPAHVATLEGILDRISQTPDGQALIKKAFEISGSGENTVEIATSHKHFTLGGKQLEKHDWGTSGAADIYPHEGKYEGKLTIDLDGVGKIGHIAPDGSLVAGSRTNVLVHEMFHLADPHLRPDIRDAEYKNALREELEKIIHIENADEITKARVLDAAVDNVFRDFGLTSKLDTKQLFSPERLIPLQEIAGEHAITVTEPQGVLFTKLRGSIRGNDSYPIASESGVSIHPSPEGGSWRHEEQCIKWVDRFMLKYFGEPPRQGYGNLVRMPEGSPIPKEPELLASPIPDDQLPEYIPNTFFSPSIQDPPAPLGFSKPSTHIDAVSESQLGTFGAEDRLWSAMKRNLPSHRPSGMGRNP